MRELRILFFAFLFIFGTNTVFSQEQLGLRLESYSGVNSLGINPANGLSSSFKWDLNLVGAGVFGQTNYGFVYNTNVPDILQTLPEVDAATNYTSERQWPDNTLIVDFNDDNRDKYFTGSSVVLGPSLMVNLESGHSFGIFTNFRTMVSAQGVPSELNFYHFDRTPLGEPFSIAPFNAAGMVWSEIGFNYSRRIETSNGFLDIGGSVKFINGYEAFFANNKSSFDITQLPGDTVTFDAPNFEFGFTSSNTAGDDFALKRNGGGVAFDLGAVVTIDGYEDEYIWKFGAALLDIGKVNFSRNAQSHVINTDFAFDIPTGDYDDIDNVDDALDLFSAQSLGDSMLSLQDLNFGIWMPGALSLQADYHIVPHVFVNATLIQRLPFKENALKRGNLLALTPRFEHRWFSAMLPVSVYNYNKLRVGAALRLAFLTIGTENLGSIVGNSNFTGTDFYFALKVNPFNVGLNFSGGGRGGKNVKCYEF